MAETRTRLLAITFYIQFTGIRARLENRCGTARVSEHLVSLTQNEYICPRENDPVTFTECCYNGCCEKNYFSQLNEELIMIIGVTVITLCMLLMAVTIICCFWSKCPCYTICKPNYTGSETIIYSLSKDDPNLLMPNESEGNQFAPCLVKIKKVEEY